MNRAAKIALAVGLTLFITYFGCVLLEKSEAYREAAGRYAEYAEAYDPPPGSQYVAFSSCYGERWDAFTEAVRMDIVKQSGDKRHRQHRANRYRSLASCYRKAASRPWRGLPTVPPESP